MLTAVNPARNLFQPSAFTPGVSSLSGGFVVLLAPRSAAPNRFLAAAALIDDLPALVSERREKQGLTPKAAAKLIGIGSTTLTHFEAGSTPTKPTIQAVLHWLGS